MAHYSTVFHQLLQIFSRHEFDRMAEQHHGGQKFRSFNRWSQFGALIMGQVTGRKSLLRIWLSLVKNRNIRVSLISYGQHWPGRMKSNRFLCLKPSSPSC